MADAYYTKCYVAFLDVLGFKERVTDPQVSCQDILDMYHQFNFIYTGFYEGQSEEITGNVKMKIMSDSICLYIREDIPNALLYLTLFCVAFQCHLLDLPGCAFMRGGISFGDMYVKDDIIFGPALTDAYLLEEHNARVPRIIIRKSTLDRGMSSADETSRGAMEYWTFEDEDAFYAMNYFKLLGRKELSGVRARVKQLCGQYLDTTIDESIRQKYLYVKRQLQKYEPDKA